MHPKRLVTTSYSSAQQRMHDHSSSPKSGSSLQGSGDHSSAGLTKQLVAATSSLSCIQEVTKCRAERDAELCQHVVNESVIITKQWVLPQPLLCCLSCSHLTVAQQAAVQQSCDGRAVQVLCDSSIRGDRMGTWHWLQQSSNAFV
jgi:hypothetical protein